MLGCHDFCGYYEWTFHYLRRRFGVAALEKYWAEAIAADSQRHYVSAAREKGLQGLFESWSKTGVDEHCDWSVTHDEDRNLVRLDMRWCPSKGFLLDNNRNADEDYCDHCIGWISPALSQAGFEVAGHEHNHCGQCWWEIRGINAQQPAVDVECDIRRDPRWGHGYLHRFEHGEKLPLQTGADHSDSCDVLTERFRAINTIAVLGPKATESDFALSNDPDVAVIVSGEVYAGGHDSLGRIDGVVLEHNPDRLTAVARRFQTSEHQPLLMHAYLPNQPFLNFAEHGLPRAAPILPILLRTRLYVHHPHRPHPEIDTFAVMLAAALKKRIRLVGVDLPSDAPPKQGIRPIDLDYLAHAWRHVAGQIECPPNLLELLSNELERK